MAVLLGSNVLGLAAEAVPLVILVAWILLDG